MSALERKANLFRKFLHGKYNQKHKYISHCIVSPSGKLCQIQIRRNGEVIKKQTIPWSNLEPVPESGIEALAKETLSLVELMFNFAAA